MIFLMNTYQGEGSSQGFGILFFNWSPICCDFLKQFYFQRSSFFTLFQRNYIDTTVTFSKQLFLQSSCFCLRSSFLEQLLLVIFSEELNFQSETSSEQSFFENRTFFRAVIFRSSYFFGGGIICNKNSYKRATFSKQVLLHSITFLENLHFEKSQFYGLWRITYLFRRAIFLERLFFQKTLSSTTANFPEELLFTT